MREIVLDTETTGLDPLRGDRLVEVGCVEIFNRMPTGQTFHRYINPERDMPAEAFAVHGLSSRVPGRASRCSRKWSRSSWNSSAMRRWSSTTPRSTSASSMPSSTASSGQPIPRDRLVDTLLLARRKHPGVSNRLDDLCSRYAIDNSRRTKHGALLDAELLAEVYIDLIGARQSQLILASETRDISVSAARRDAAPAARGAAGAANHRRRPRSASRLCRHAWRQADLERFSAALQPSGRLAAKLLEAA